LQREGFTTKSEKKFEKEGGGSKSKMYFYNFQKMGLGLSKNPSEKIVGKKIWCLQKKSGGTGGNRNVGVVGAYQKAWTDESMPPLQEQQTEKSTSLGRRTIRKMGIGRPKGLRGLAVAKFILPAKSRFVRPRHFPWSGGR